MSQINSSIRESMNHDALRMHITEEPGIRPKMPCQETSLPAIGEVRVGRFCADSRVDSENDSVAESSQNRRLENRSQIQESSEIDVVPPPEEELNRFCVDSDSDSTSSIRIGLESILKSTTNRNHNRGGQSRGPILDSESAQNRIQNRLKIDAESLTLTSPNEDTYVMFWFENENTLQKYQHCFRRASK